eukprot:scaffold1568_cov65-Phaeocystis_antarctica.AAC.2
MYTTRRGRISCMWSQCNRKFQLNWCKFRGSALMQPDVAAVYPRTGPQTCCNHFVAGLDTMQKSIAGLDTMQNSVAGLDTMQNPLLFAD